MKKTMYYLVSDDAGRYVIAQQGNKTAVFDPDFRGKDKTTGVSLYDSAVEGEKEELETVRRNLSEAYGAVDGLYSMEEIERDFPDKVYIGEDLEVSFKGLIAEVEEE